MSDPFWEQVRVTTPARIGLTRVGDAIGTREWLDFGAAHASARDAVHRTLDVPALREQIAALGFGEPSVVASAASDRSEYLRRPDLGRLPGHELDAVEPVDLAIVIADGLSAEATMRHAAPLLAELRPLLGVTTIGAPVIATQARVALGDHVGQALQAGAVLVLIGERPGLSAADSLGAYLTWAPAPGILDSARNCVSNIREPGGLTYRTAARTLSSLYIGAKAIGATGVNLKDGSNALI